MFSHICALQRKIYKTVYEYSKKYIDKFELIVVHLLQKLTDIEKQVITASFINFSQEQNIELKSKIIMNHILKRWSNKKI